MIDAKIFKRYANLVISAVPKKPLYPVLGMIWVRVSKTNLKFVVQNDRYQLHHTFDIHDDSGDDIEPLTFLVDPGTLKALSKTLKAKSKIAFEWPSTDKSTWGITVDGVTQNLPVDMNTQEFPAIKSMHADPDIVGFYEFRVELDTHRLKPALQSALAHTSSDNVRPVLQHVRMCRVDDHVAVESSDSFRLAHHTIPVADADLLVSRELDILLPRDVVKLIIRALYKTVPHVGIYQYYVDAFGYDPKNICITAQDTYIFVTGSPDKYPDTAGICEIATQDRVQGVFDARALLSALDAAKEAHKGRKTHNGIYVRCEKGKAQITFIESGEDYSDLLLSVPYEGSVFEDFAINVRYLRDVIYAAAKRYGLDEVKLWLPAKSDQTPIAVTPVHAHDPMWVVMSMYVSK